MNRPDNLACVIIGCFSETSLLKHATAIWQQVISRNISTVAIRANPAKLKQKQGTLWPTNQVPVKPKIIKHSGGLLYILENF